MGLLTLSAYCKQTGRAYKMMSRYLYLSGLQPIEPPDNVHHGKYGEVELVEALERGRQLNRKMLRDKLDKQVAARQEAIKKIKAVKVSRRKVTRGDWVGYKPGTRLRITNAAGRQWVGIFDRYNEVFGYIKLQHGEMLFARDAILEVVDESVPLSYDDGLAEYAPSIIDPYDFYQLKEE